MFASKSSSSDLEHLIKKATDETLTADNWQYILDVCDQISANPEERTQQAINYVSQRLSVKDANVILRSLSLLVAIAENCGSRMRQQIATKSFVQGTLIKKLGDKKLHRTVKCRICEVIEQLYQSFKNDPSLKPMTDAYNEIKRDYSQFMLQGKAGPAPNKPAKMEISKEDKMKEEDDLQRVLQMSLQEYERENSIKKSYLRDKPLPSTEEAVKQPIVSQKAGAGRTNKDDDDDNAKTITSVSKVRALYDLVSYEPDELSFRKGDVITVIESVYRDWWRGSLPNGKVGIFPLNYVTPIVAKSEKELNQELETEDTILSVDLRKVDHLLALLSSNSNSNEDEITSLYNEIIPLRPSLGKFIDKYSVRKEELMALNYQLNNEMKLYNELADQLITQRVNRRTSMPTAPPYPTFSRDNGNMNSSGREQSYGAHQNVHPYPPTNLQQYLQQQPTGSGFGNGSINMHPPQAPSGDYYMPHQPPPTSFNQRRQSSIPSHTGIPPNYSGNPPTNDQFLNVNRFPDVNNL
ncbi:uncharacterized protein PRCAT00006197001 [Priceomyces carsonii]|uniref:uncharacterized protein n=1 Tax=Priceomyces carsonii TaxID=28549 RepID=UPI002EDA7689|nr:unnamed protein product [Priceomyces carsonii]